MLVNTDQNEHYAGLDAAVGLIAWGASKDDLGYLRIEFGLPHLIVRNPIDEHASSEAVRRLLSRRAVRLRGDLHVWIQNCEWQVLLAHENGPPQPADLEREAIDGRYVNAVEFLQSERARQTVVKFEGGLDLLLTWNMSITDDREVYSTWNIDGRRSAMLLNDKVITKTSPRNIYTR